MGRASKWMVHFMLGKKEERAKKKEVAFIEENVAKSAAIVPSSPKIRRRWSFGRSSSKEKAHQRCKSLDLITRNPVVVDAMVELEKHQQQQRQSKALLAVAVVKSAAVERLAAAPKLEIDEASKAVISRVVQDSAATKIQALFRSYLARKALCALRGLVKLQAVVRGHLVRKQTTATLRQMHALMAIQVRARFHRIQMAEEETQLVVKTQSSRYGNIIPHDNNGFRRPLRETIDFNACRAQGASNSKNGNFSGDVSFSEREFSFSTAHNTPQHYYFHETPKIIPGRASISGQKPEYLLSLPDHDHSFLPNYMANTKSSKAKVRSHSEPKRRPGSNAKGTRTASMDSTGVPPVTPRSGNGNPDPWFVKLYRSRYSRRLGKESESDDANSTITSSHSYYGNNSVMAYEPHVSMY